MAAYATTTDLGNRWSAMPTDAASQTTAATLLGDASFWVRQWFPTQTAAMDAGTLDSTGAKILVCSMVKRAMRNEENDGVRQDTQTMGPMTEMRLFSNPDGNLYILDNEATLIQGGARMRSKAMTGSGPSVGGTRHYGAINQPGPLLWPGANYWPGQFPNL